jgi:hypothetical protein
MLRKPARHSRAKIHRDGDERQHYEENSPSIAPFVFAKPGQTSQTGCAF